jgi:hypothetical protein
MTQSEKNESIEFINKLNKGLNSVNISAFDIYEMIDYYEGARFQINYRIGEYNHAQHHLNLVISNRIKKIMHRHC